eukprot:SAG22_NODE_6770_length_813_cov_1.372549_1_plen_257_part_10
MLHNTMAELGDGYRAVGASEMARLARDGCNRTGLPPSPPPSPSPSPSLRTWTLVSNTECHSESYRWGNVSSIAACEALCDQSADCALWSFCRSKANNCTSVGDGCWGYPRRTPALQGCQRNVGWTSGVCKSGCPKGPHVPPLLPTCLQPSYERWMGVSPSTNSTANPVLVGDNYSLAPCVAACNVSPSCLGFSVADAYEPASCTLHDLDEVAALSNVPCSRASAHHSPRSQFAAFFSKPGEVIPTRPGGKLPYQQFA